MRGKQTILITAVVSWTASLAMVWRRWNVLKNSSEVEFSSRLWLSRKANRPAGSTYAPASGLVLRRLLESAGNGEKRGGVLGGGGRLMIAKFECCCGWSVVTSDQRCDGKAG